MEFTHGFVERQDGYAQWGAAAVADFDGDGRPEFTTGGEIDGGFLHLYDWNGSWCRFEVTHEVSPNVGATPVDVDGDGRPELVYGEWGERLLWTPLDPHGEAFGEVVHVGGDFDDPHDVVSGDLDGDGEDEVVVREKGGRLMRYEVAEDPRAEWDRETLADHLPGDGTAIADLDGDGQPDIVTAGAWFENEGTAGGWRRIDLPLPADWHPETRVAVGDVDGDSRREVVVTESEADAMARLAVLSHGGEGLDWEVEVVIGRDRDRRAMHSLELADLDGDGDLEVFSAEMENGKTDGQQTHPEWFVLEHAPSGWEETTLLDANLGAHEAKVADFDGDGAPEVVGKVWRANSPNGNGGRHHVSWLDG